MLFATLAISPAVEAGGPELVLQAGHTGEITSITFSPDSRYLVTCSRDGRAILWEVATGRLIRIYTPEAGGCYAAAVSPDTKTLITGHYMNTFVMWELASGKILHRIDTTSIFDGFSLDANAVHTISFDLDCKLFWVNKAKSKLLSYETDTGRWRGTKVFPGRVSILQAKDGPRVVYAASKDETTYKVINFETGEVIAQQTHPKNDNLIVYARLLSPEGRFEARRQSERPNTDNIRFVVWDVQKQAEIYGKSGSLEPIAFLDKPTRIVVVNGSLDIVDIATGKVQRLQGPKEAVYSKGAAVSPDGKYLATFHDHHVNLWSLQTFQHVRQLGQTKESAPLLASTNEPGRGLYTARGRSVTRWNLMTGHPDHVWQIPEYSKVTALTHAHRHKRVMVGGEEKVYILDSELMRVENTVETPKTKRGLFGLRGAKNLLEPVRSAVVTQDERFLMVGFGDSWGSLLGSTSGSVGGLICELPTSTVHATLSVPGNDLACGGVDISADGSTVAFCRESKTEDEKRPFAYGIHVWDVAKQRERGIIPAAERVTVRVSQDGQQIVIGTYKSIAIHDATTLKPTRKLEVHKYVAEGLFDRLFKDDLPVITPLDRTTYVSGGADGRTMLWDAVSGKVGKQLTNHLTNITSVGKFGPDRVFSCAVDGSIRLLDIRTGDLLGTLVLGDNNQDWLVVTPEGFFDGSLGGREKVAFRVGGGLNVVPVDRFFQDFYYPGLLAAIWRGETPKPKADFGSQTPPIVRLTAPRDGDTDQETVTVEVEAVDQGGGVSGPLLYHNGTRLFAPTATRKEGKTVRRTFTVRLVEGANRIEARAASADGSWESEPARVVVRYARAVVKPDLYVLAVGVDKYADDRLNLKFAGADARALGALFDRRGRSIYAGVQVTVLLDDKATRSGIVAVLEQIGKAAQPRDTFVLFLSGHGTTLGQRYYFLPHEFQRGPNQSAEEAARKHGIPADELGDLLGKVPALKKVLILDTCGSGGATGLLQKSRNPFAFRGEIERLNRTQGVYTIAAAAATEEAQEAPDLGHGVLTYALLAGLRAVDRGPLEGRGVQPASPDQVADVLEWLGFASGQVPRLMKQFFGREQDVEVRTQGSAFPILPVRER